MNIVMIEGRKKPKNSKNQVSNLRAGHLDLAKLSTLKTNTNK
jgi:hypothetical protein